MKVLSKETISENDSSDSESSDSTNNSVPEAQNKTQEKPAKETPQKRKLADRTVKARSESPSTSVSGSESESESEPEVASPESASPNKSSKKQNSAPQSTTQNIPAKQYTPPEGFHPIQKSSSESTDVPNAFSNTKGKQIWHITAPVGVPFTSIRELALDAVATGQSVLSHQGSGYRLHEEQLGSEKTKMLLIPDKGGKSYRRNPVPVAQTFHVEQIVNTPNNAIVSQDETTSTIHKLSRPLPSKPKHLRMRYRPFGSAEGPPETLGSGSGSEESESEDVTFQQSKGSRVDREVKKRKHNDLNKTKAPESASITAKEELPRKKSKKTHKENKNSTPKDEDRSNSPVQVSQNSDVRGREEKKAHNQETTKRRKDENSQERKARKGEKKRKKRDKSA